MPSPAASVFGYLNWTFAETYELLYRTRGWFVHLAWNMAKYWLDWPFRFTSRKDRRLTLGGALTGALRLALGERQVPLWLECPLVELVREKGKVTGAIVSRRGKRLRIGARKGVVLAAGGFDKDQAMRDAHAPLYRQALYSGGVASNTGDGITAGQAAGAGTMNLQGIVLFQEHYWSLMIMLQPLAFIIYFFSISAGVSVHGDAFNPCSSTSGRCQFSRPPKRD